MCVLYRVFGFATVAVALAWAPAGAQDDLSGQAHALRQVIATMESEAAELEPRLAQARARLEALRQEEEAIQAAIAEGRAEQDRQDAALHRDQEQQNDGQREGRDAGEEQ